MSFEIRVNGTTYELWESVSVVRSIDANAGAFKITNSSTLPVASYPVKTGDFVEIFIGGVRKIAGFVDDISGNNGDKNNTLIVSGRDNIADLIDSSVPDSGKVTEGPVSLKALCENVIKSLGADISVVDSVGGLDEFTDEDLQAAASGANCMDYLVSFARKRQVYLVPSGDGKLFIYRPDIGNKSLFPIENKPNGTTNNIISSSFRKSQSGRFSTYLCRSQDNFGFSVGADYAGDGTDRKNQVVDSQIRGSRYLEILAEESMSDEECLARAAEESNLRRALGLEYNPVVAGTNFDFGVFVDVDDEYADIKGNFLIKSVEYNIDIDTGSTTKLTCVPPDAYQVQAEANKENSRSSKTSTKLQNTTPKPQPATIR